MPRDPRVQKLQRLRTERVTRAAGGYYGTRATAYGNVRSGPRKRDTGRTLLSLALFVVVMAVALYLASQYVAHGLRPQAEQAARTVTVDIPPGENASDLAQLLADKGLVPNAFLFNLIYLRGQNINYTAGPHTLRTSMTADEIAKAIGAPPVIPVATVQLKDGWRAEQVAEALAAAHVASYADLMHEIEYDTSFQSRYSFLSDRPVGASLEGYLFPDTYKFPLNSSPRAAIDEILQAFNNKVTSVPNLVAQGKQRYGSFYKAITMASLVEREAGTAHDRGLIASVYYNRLHDATRQFINFGADPAIQYILGHPGDWWPQITRADIDRTQDKAMNTHHHPGLPPQPIASPSLASIEAAVHPDNTPYMAFTHHNGSHSMSSFCTAQQYVQANDNCDTTPE